MKQSKTFKKLSAFLLSTAMLASSVTAFAEYPMPDENNVYGIVGSSNLIGGYPSKINDVGSGNAFAAKWLTELNGKSAVKDYSNPAKRFTVGDKHFILLDTDDAGNYFVIADDLYGVRSYLNVAYNLDGTAEGSWNDVYYKGEWMYDPANKYSIANWLNTDFLEKGNTVGGVEYKLPDSITSNLVEKEWWMEAEENISDDYFYQKMGAEAPKYTSVDSYKITQKISLLSATEYWTYWEDISPLVYGADNSLTNWSDNAWLLRTPNNIKLNAADGKNKLAIYISACNSGGSGTRADSTTYNHIGVRPCFWLESDFFETVKLDALDKNATSIVSELKKAPINQLLDMYSKEELAAVGITFVSDTKVEDLHIKGQAIAGNTISADFIAEAAETKVEWMHADSQNGQYSKVADGNELTIKDSYAGWMKFKVTPVNSFGEDGFPEYSDAFKVTKYGEYPYTKMTDIQPNDKYVMYNSLKDSFTVDDASMEWKEFIILDKAYGADGKPQLFIYSNHAAGKCGWATNVAGATNNNASQKFDPALTGSVAYRMNVNDMSSIKIDSNMLNYTKDHTWLTEAGLNDVLPSAYATKAKIALLSYTEYEKYSNKIGPSGKDSADDTGTTLNTIYLRTPYGVRINNAKAENAQTVACLTTNSGISVVRFTDAGNLQSGQQGVRAALYVDMDYFKNNKVSIDSTVAAEESALYDYLAKHYTYEDMVEMYGAKADEMNLVSEYDMPGISDLKINGTLAVGSTLTAEYTSADAASANYQWYAMGASGTYEAIEGATEKSYKLTDDEMGREILVAVQPVNADGVAGIETTVYTAEVVRPGVKTSISANVTMSGAEVCADFDVTSQDGLSGAAVIAVYDAEGAMVDCKIEEVSFNAGEDTVSVTFSGYNQAGTRCKAMLWKDIDGMVPWGTYAEAAKE